MFISNYNFVHSSCQIYFVYCFNKTVLKKQEIKTGNFYQYNIYFQNFIHVFHNLSYLFIFKNIFLG